MRPQWEPVPWPETLKRWRGHVAAAADAGLAPPLSLGSWFPAASSAAAAVSWVWWRGRRSCFWKNMRRAVSYFFTNKIGKLIFNNNFWLQHTLRYETSSQ
jgi:hypothetical protein